MKHQVLGIQKNHLQSLISIAIFCGHSFHSALINPRYPCFCIESSMSWFLVLVFCLIVHGANHEIFDPWPALE